MTACPSCGEPSMAEAKWCEACGADLEDPAAPICVACGERQITADGYCSSCGHKQPAPRDHMELRDGVSVAITDRGIKHRDNEDAAAIGALPTGGAVLVVCDGVSSTPGSAVASLAAATAARDLLIERVGAAPNGRIDEALIEATALAQVRAASAPVPAVNPNDPHSGGGPPSSTLVAAVARPVEGRVEISVAWVGDSRAYWVADGIATALTDDHELGGSLTRWLGADSLDPTPELTYLMAEGPGRLVVVSDGLWRYQSVYVPPAPPGTRRHGIRRRGLESRGTGQGDRQASHHPSDRGLAATR